MYVKQKEFNESIDISVTIAYLDKEQDQLTKKQEQFDPYELWKQICNNVSIKKYTPIAVTRSTLSLFFNWDSLHARVNSHYRTAWSYKKKKHIKAKEYRKSVWKEPTIKRCMLIPDLKPLRS